jgi:hypothetical protein
MAAKAPRPAEMVANQTTESSVGAVEYGVRGEAIDSQHRPKEQRRTGYQTRRRPIPKTVEARAAGKARTGWWTLDLKTL